MDEVFRDLLEALGCSEKQSVGGELVDEPGGAARVVVDEALGVVVKDVLGGLDGLELEVDVEEGFFIGEMP